MSKEVNFYYNNSNNNDESAMFIISTRDGLLKVIEDLCDMFDDGRSNCFVYQNPFDNKWRVVERVNYGIPRLTVYTNLNDIPEKYGRLVPEYKKLKWADMDF